ncbi:MAG: PTS transporter subunit EIIB [Fusobacterium sp.]|nr:PTS transporter subunit EIIB [Fusobacterium sp.]
MESANWLYIIIGVVVLLIVSIIVKKYNLITKLKRVNCIDLDKLEDKKLSGVGKLYIKALGGEKNIVSIDTCLTRIRVVVKNGELIDEKRILVLGAKKVIRLTQQKAHIVVGLKAEKLARAINEIRNK